MNCNNCNTCNNNCGCNRRNTYNRCACSNPFININDGCGSTHLNNIANYIKERKLHFTTKRNKINLKASYIVNKDIAQKQKIDIKP